MTCGLTMTKRTAMEAMFQAQTLYAARKGGGDAPSSSRKAYRHRSSK